MVLDSEIEDSFVALGISALPVKGEVKELKQMFSELLEQLDPGIKPLDNKFSCGTVMVPKKSLGAGCMRVADTFVVAISSTEKD